MVSLGGPHGEDRFLGKQGLGHCQLRLRAGGLGEQWDVERGKWMREGSLRGSLWAKAKAIGLPSPWPQSLVPGGSP